ncbi:MAG: single-stranded-DNA-specific exonuclease RecJ, partial [Candidatus Moraniibacteriota bacterium]
LILTLDCGMMNHAEIEEAGRRHIDVIIIDHHHVPEVLPSAFAIVNPKLPTETYPFRELCGAGTSFKVATALYQRYLPAEVEQLKWLLDVVATGTVADVMPLIGENRTIVKYGLIVLQKTHRAGFQEMFAVGRIPIGETGIPDARMIAFQIAPRINAASRMAHPILAHNLLMERDTVKARGLALELETYNVARQKVSQETTERIRALAEEKYQGKKFIFAVGEEYPLGVIGLVAGKIARELGKPTCILQRGPETSTGSFRSIPGLNIIEAIEVCSDLLVKFGGHAQAAGMTIRNDNLDRFYERFNTLLEEKLASVVTEPELWIDLTLHPGDITLDLVRGLRKLEPFGEGNPEPIFALEDMIVMEARTVGKEGKHWKLKLKNGGEPKVFDAVGWSLVEAFPELQSGDRIDIAFQLSENSWNGSTTVQLKLLDINPSQKGGK